MSTPDIYIQTAFVLNREGRIISTREPGPTRGPVFVLVRNTSRCAWAMREDVPEKLCDELDNLARDEPPPMDLRDTPVHADRYISLIGGQVESGPAYIFPDVIAQSGDTVLIEDSQLLAHNFRGWTAVEILGRSPILAIVEDGYPVSVCFCARRSHIAAEAGLETASPFRGRGFAPRVTAAWASAVRASGRIPLYSTSWKNEASLAVARKLLLVTYASTWTVSG